MKARGYMDGRPLLWAAVCFVAGSSAAAYWSPGGALSAGLGLGLLLAALALAGQARPGLAAACLAAYALAAGERLWADARSATALSALYAAASAQLPPTDVPAVAEGVIASPVEIDGDVVQLRMTAQSVRAGDAQQAERLRERLLVRVKLLREAELDAARQWRRGDRIAVSGALQLPAGPANRGGFDYRRYLRSQGIHWLLQVQGAGAADVSPGSPWSAAALLGRADAVRSQLGSALERSYPASQSGYMKALVLGDSDDIDPGLYAGFARLGLTHIMAVSGMHVAVMLGLLGFLLRLCRLTKEQILLALMLAVPPYVLLTGAAPSIIRAGVMALIGLAAARAGKLKDGLHLLAASAVLMLLWDPRLIESVSFQLSFIVTAGLILGVPAVNRLLPHIRKGRFLLDSLVVTVVAQAASFPVSIYYFNQFHLLSLPANLLLVPFISLLIMPAGAAVMLLEPIWPGASHVIAALSSRGNDWSFRVVDGMSSWRGGATIWAKPSLWWIFAWYGALACLLAASAAWRRVRKEKRQPSPEETSGDETGPLPDAGHLEPHWPEGGNADRWLTASDCQNNRHGGPPGGSRRDYDLKSLSSGGKITPAAFVDRLFRTFTNEAPRFLRSPGFCFFACFAAVVLLLFHAYHPDWPRRSAQVDFLNVGQGDSTLIRTPSGKVILIDGGGTMDFGKEPWRIRRDPYEIGRKTLVPLLMQRGVHHIDLLVATHLDQDHIGGLAAVLDSIPVRRLLWNGTLKEAGKAEPILQAAVDLDIPVYSAGSGQSRQADASTRLDVLWPLAASSQASTAKGERELAIEEEQNEESIVLMVSIYGRRFLLPGDLGSASEQELIRESIPEFGQPSRGATEQGLPSTAASGPRQASAEAKPGQASTKAGFDHLSGEARSGQPLTLTTTEKDRPTSSVDVLKAGHHGSKNSTSPLWLAYWKPTIAVLSAGLNNRYGHPSADTMERLHEARILAVRTDLDGEIQFEIRKESLRMRLLRP
ncbi:MULTISPECIES: ComEC/Rec2 family competence protein [unclassified Paenibacillus]|uniref:ComEC/Rec2 family competence protein n=1 Tax=unclassified Paenibacillus TaxID=185978 RepID=UPI000956C705|nr:MULTISPECIES: ComEC/Rec2 family competence protein [unclassified Paenibacillus]ASS66076.2 DUF4131 domain-containing protein [Paenibacillus sp. RUD330]SIQ13324.1 competence protein ComEC [Paenibacillus sp. RU4X]SIQ35116.1 competence protein ComEC [Paenibacillus sp. RU4T]